VFSAELDGGFEREDGIGETFALEAFALLLHTIISDVGAHAVCNDGGKGFVGDVDDADGAPVVWVGSFSFLFKDWAEGASSPFFWDRSTLPDGLEHFEDEDDGTNVGLIEFFCGHIKR